MKVCHKCEEICPFFDCVYNPEREENIRRLLRVFAKNFSPRFLKLKDKDFKSIWREVELIEQQTVFSTSWTIDVGITKLAQSKDYERYCNLVEKILNFM